MGQLKSPTQNTFIAFAKLTNTASKVKTLKAECFYIVYEPLRLTAKASRLDALTCHERLPFFSVTLHQELLGPFFCPCVQLLRRKEKQIYIYIM